ncbi:MAG: hypothetical protein ACE5F2_02240 [Candidatus Paceibacteria bacterium]
MVNENQGAGERQMFEGNWTCSGCSGAITQLPFQPDPGREGGLLCRDCHRGKMADRPRREGPRQMHQGNWKCSSCSGDITELPFEPDPARADQLKCRDCFRNK